MSFPQRYLLKDAYESQYIQDGSISEEGATKGNFVLITYNKDKTIDIIIAVNLCFLKNIFIKIILKNS